MMVEMKPFVPFGLSFRTKELTVAFSTYILPAAGCAFGADGWSGNVTTFTGEIDHVSFEVLAFSCVFWDVSVLNSWGLWAGYWQKRPKGHKEADQTILIGHICSLLLPFWDKEICKLPHTWSKRRMSLIFQRLLWVQLGLNVSKSLLPVYRICVFILTFCLVKVMQESLNSAWWNHCVDINTSMHGNNPWNFLLRVNSYGKWPNLQKWHWGHSCAVLVWFWRAHQVKIKPRNISCFSKVAVSTLPSGVSFFFVHFSWWLNMFSPILIATFDWLVWGIDHRTNSTANIWWSNWDEVHLGNKTFYLCVQWAMSHVRPRLFWSTCQSSVCLMCWRMCNQNHTLSLSFKLTCTKLE